MIQLQVLNKVLQDKNYSLIGHNGLDKRFFQNYADEFIFIEKHFEKYKTVPDIETFLGKFPDFTIFKVEETDRYLTEAALEAKTYSDMVPVLNRTAQLMKDDSFEAVDYALKEIPKIMSRRSIFGENVINTASDRLAEMKEKKSKKSRKVITTGLDELDKVVDGWSPGEELVTIVGRTNQGKTWFGLKLATAAYQAGYRVGMYSGEMSARKIGYRIDTFLSGMSNRNLNRGSFDDFSEYEEYIDKLRNRRNPFIVITPKDLGGRATVSQMKSFVEEYHLDFLLIDGYMLMKDERGAHDRTTKLENILQDLWDMSIDCSIPIIGLAQANREGAKKADEEGTPELEHIYGGDSIGQYSSRVISMRQTGPGLQLDVKKNREGFMGQRLVYYWDIDRGEFKYIPAEKDAVGGEKVNEVRREFQRRDSKEIF